MTTAGRSTPYICPKPYTIGSIADVQNREASVKTFPIECDNCGTPLQRAYLMCPSCECLDPTGFFTGNSMPDAPVDDDDDDE